MQLGRSSASPSHLGSMALLMLLDVVALGACRVAHATELPPGMRASMLHHLERHRMHQDRREQQAELSMQQLGGEEEAGGLEGRALLQSSSSAPPIRIHAEFQLSASLSAAGQLQIKEVVGIAILTLQKHIQVGWEGEGTMKDGRFQGSARQRRGRQRAGGEAEQDAHSCMQDPDRLHAETNHKLPH